MSIHKIEIYQKTLDLDFELKFCLDQYVNSFYFYHTQDKNLYLYSIDEDDNELDKLVEYYEADPDVKDMLSNAMIDFRNKILKYNIKENGLSIIKDLNS